MKKGFTLIEIVVALLIFSIIAVMMAAGLNFLIRAESSLKTQAEQLEALQMTRLLMERNLSQVVDRSITIDAKTQYPAFIGDTAIIEFTHGGYINPQGQFTRSTLQRTAYLLENGALIERDWSALDRAPKTLTRDRILIKNVGSMAFRFVDDQKNFHRGWPPGIKKEDLSTKLNNELPRAVQVTINLGKNNKIIWVLMIKGKKLGE